MVFNKLFYCKKKFFHIYAFLYAIMMPRFKISDHLDQFDPVKEENKWDSLRNYSAV